MKIEAIILYILQVIFLLLEVYLAYLVLKYLNRKPLGKQTILDKIVKDTILSMLLDQIIRVIVMSLIVEFASPLGKDMAFIITNLLHFFSVLKFWYMFSVIMVRYILVFYHTYLNIFDEKVTRRIIRCFVCICSAIIILADSKNSKYYLLIGDESLDSKSVPKVISTLTIIIPIVIVITQCQIEKFKKAVDRQSFDNLETIQEDQGAERCMNKMNFNPYRIEIITGLLIGLMLLFFQFSVYYWQGDLYINRLRKTLLIQVSTIILVLMFVIKNENLYIFIKQHICFKLLCLSSEDIHIPNNDNMFVIYKPKYEVYDNFNFNKIEEKIVTRHNPDNQLGHQKSNVHEFSSVIFVKEKGSDFQNIDGASVLINNGKKFTNHYEQMPGCSHWPDDV